jgi:signal transduction histidine kinase
MNKTINDMLFNPEASGTPDERSQHEIKMEYLIKQGFTTDNIEMKSDLSKSAIKAISKGLMHALIFNDSTLETLARTVMVLNVSKDRKGRQELTEISKMIGNDQPDNQSNVLGRLLG